MKRLLTYVLSFVIILSISNNLYLKYNHRKEVNLLTKNISRVKKEILKQREKDSLTIITNAEKIDSIDGLYFAQKKETIKWKDQFFEIKSAAQETTKTGGTKISFADSNKCIKVKGYTVTKTDSLPAYAKVDFNSFPVAIERDFISIEDQLTEIITPKNDCIEFINNKFLIPSDQLKYERPKGFGWKEYALGGLTGILLISVIK